MANTKERIDPEIHQQQVALYRDRRDTYVAFAALLEEVLAKACEPAVPTAVVRTRAKTIASFAEKCARRYPMTKDPVNEFTDLCGGRVIVETLEHVKWVRAFIEANFEVLEADEKSLHLGEDKFGYRDMHYVLRLAPAKASALGVTPVQAEAFGALKAEVQVRTWVEHAWADVIHDRLYKAGLNYPAEFRRKAALLAAIMEDGDMAFADLASQVDGMLVNFTAYARRPAVEEELAVQSLILESVGEAERASVALRIARLQAAAGRYQEVVDRLTPFAGYDGPPALEILAELGYALCKARRDRFRGAPYRQGKDYLQRVVDVLRAPQQQAAVPNLRRRRSLLARSLVRLAWVLTAEPRQGSVLARACYQEALELEPANPYFLADVVGFEASCMNDRGFVGAMAAVLKSGIATCRQHMAAGTEMPFAAFTSGRLRLLLREHEAALRDYARGILHMLSGEYLVPPDALDMEEDWLQRVTPMGNPPADGVQWALELIDLARRTLALHRPEGAPAKPRMPKALIVAGGAASLPESMMPMVQAILTETLADFEGLVLSGGTRSGVPGCVGAAAKALADGGRKRFRAVGYIPKGQLPDDAERDERYDEHVVAGEKFCPVQMLRNWVDILEAGIDPTDVCVLGFGGGKVAAIEYRLALALGARVGIVEGTGGTADELLADQTWIPAKGLIPLPQDPATARAFVIRRSQGLTDDQLDAMARVIHGNYVADNPGRMPANLRPWPEDPANRKNHELEATFQRANIKQADYAVEILRAVGFEVRPAADPANVVVFDDFTDDDVDRMAELEHGRWNADRLEDGWRYAAERSDDEKLHDALVPWSRLPDGTKYWDRQAVRNFPQILKIAGLEVFPPARPEGERRSESGGSLGAAKQGFRAR